MLMKLLMLCGGWFSIVVVVVGLLVLLVCSIVYVLCVSIVFGYVLDSVVIVLISVLGSVMCVVGGNLSVVW